MAGFSPLLPYTTQQQEIERRRKLAEAMLEANLGSQKGYTSWAQALGQIANVWAGKRMESKADDQETDLNNKTMQQYAAALQGLNHDADSGMTPQQLVEKYQANPLVSENLKPYQEAMASALKNREGIEKLPDGTYGRIGDYVGPGAKPVPNDPNAMVQAGPNGSMVLNPVRMTAAMGAQGLPINNPVTNAPMPVRGPAPTPMPQATSPNNPQAAGPGQTQPGQVGAPTMPTIAGNPPAPKLRFDVQSGQWVPMPDAGGPTAGPSGGFQ